MVRPMAASAWPSDTPSGGLNGMGAETDLRVGLTVTGVVFDPKWLNADSGTTVSARKLIAEPVEVLPRPAFAREFAARLRARSSAVVAVPAAAARVNAVVPETA